MPKTFKILASVLLVAVFFSLTKVYISAQDAAKADYERAHRQYAQDLETYNKAHDFYEVAKGNYLKFRTLAAKASAQNSTSAMLKSRDDVVISYLTALKIKFNDNDLSIDAGKKSGLVSEIDTEIAWFTTHKSGYSGNVSLENLVFQSNESRNRFELINFTIYKSLYAISDSRVNKWRERLTATYESVKQLKETIKAEIRDDYKLSEKKLAIIDRWSTETELRITKSTEDQDKALVSADRIVSGANNLSAYTQAETKLEEAKKSLSQASSFVSEIIREIKTKD